MRDSKLSWDLRTNRIYSIPKTSSAIFNNYVEENKVVELHIEKSYFLGTNEYKTFIEENFFNELVSKKVCTFKKLIVIKITVDMCVIVNQKYFWIVIIINFLH